MRNNIRAEPFGKLHTQNAISKSMLGLDLFVPLCVVKLTIDFGFNNMFILVYLCWSGEHKERIKRLIYLPDLCCVLLR